MIKSELVLKIAEQNPHLYQRDVENIVNAILDTITDALARGDRVELRGFGAFSVKKRDARTGRNPRTGETVAVSEKVIPVFKTGKEMRMRLNHGKDDDASLRKRRRAGRGGAEDRAAMLSFLKALILLPVADPRRAARGRQPRPGDRYRSIRSRARRRRSPSRLPLFALIFLARHARRRHRRRRLRGSPRASIGGPSASTRAKRGVCAPTTARARPRLRRHRPCRPFRDRAPRGSDRLPPMRVVTADEIDRALTFPALVDALAEAFRADIVVAGAATITRSSGPAPAATLLLMPAWTGAADRGRLRRRQDRHRLSRQRRARACRACIGTYLLMDGATGVPLAVLDGTRLTLWRTAAASALAARYLARPDAARMVMVGAGALAPFLIRAHAEPAPDPATSRSGTTAREGRRGSRPSSRGRGPARQSRRRTSRPPCARPTSSPAPPFRPRPLVQGAWLKPGAHLDLVGAFKLAHARGRRRGPATRDRVMSIRTAPGRRAATWRWRSRAAPSARSQVRGEPHRSLPESRAGPRQSRRDHGLQVRRHGARGSRCGDAWCGGTCRRAS